MATLSKEDKAFVLEQLNSQLKTVNLKCDEFKISLALERFELKLIVGIYVNDKLEGKWFTKPEDYPFTKYLPVKRKNRYSPLKKQKIIKLYGKRRAYKEFPDLDEVIERPWPFFNTSRAALNHLLKVSDSIELIKESTARESLSKIA
ncbi:hypothetical protein F892_03093 [Acinetobacter vivianii]|uniref:Uncharacterized protein n=1 Tax=Acinetobacter vivianii TaxID=1776742 RepID=N9Q122_9GAMM|nr:hypothetical protein [Acinetobacter vivianii]ENX20170.1 hypothetical protein F892_03093 [Acinetobacter vivianii]GGI59383.1 hypothetical protein GCM10011446_08780 [Acinetobacter vivianii]